MQTTMMQKSVRVDAKAVRQIAMGGVVDALLNWEVTSNEGNVAQL
jgi:hypothetical protein